MRATDGPGRFRRTTMTRLDRLTAIGLFLLAIAVYAANRSVLPGRDTAGTMHIASQIVSSGRLTLTPSEAPRKFLWADSSGAPVPMPPASMDVMVEGKPFSEHYRAGTVVPTAPRYYLAETLRTDPVTGERQCVNTFGIGAALFAAPVLAPLRLIYGDLHLVPRVLVYGSKASATICVAASVALVFLTALAFTTRARAFWLAFAYGFGTCVWSTSSQALWQHGPNELCLALGAYAFVSHHKKPWGMFVSGAALGAATLCRPTSVFFIVTTVLWLAWSASRRPQAEADQVAPPRNTRALMQFVAGALPFVLMLAAYNTYYFGAPWRTGQGIAGAIIAQTKTGSPSLLQTPPWVGLPGLLVSPSRGLFVYSPFLLLAVYGGWLLFRKAELERLRALWVGAIAALVLESMHFDWWGGWSYGYRHIVDLTVIFAIVMAPTMNWVAAHRARTIAFALLVGWAVVVQVVGAFAYDVVGWNGRKGFTLLHPDGSKVSVLGRAAAQPYIAAGATIVSTTIHDVDLPEYRHRLWSLSDNQIGHYMTHFASSRHRRGEAVEDMITRGE